MVGSRGLIGAKQAANFESIVLKVERWSSGLTIAADDGPLEEDVQRYQVPDDSNLPRHMERTIAYGHDIPGGVRKAEAAASLPATFR